MISLDLCLCSSDDAKAGHQHVPYADGVTGRWLMRTTQNAANGLRGGFAVMQAAMMLSANKHVLRENRRNFLSAPRPETGDLRLCLFLVTAVCGASAPR